MLSVWGLEASEEEDEEEEGCQGLVGVLMKQAAAQDKRKATIPPSSCSSEIFPIFSCLLCVPLLRCLHLAPLPRVAITQTYSNTPTTDCDLADKLRLCLLRGSSLKLQANNIRNLCSHVVSFYVHIFNGMDGGGYVEENAHL